MIYKNGILLLCGSVIFSLVACSGSNTSGKKEQPKEIIENGHCPEVSTLRLDKSGYYVAPGGWRSISNGHDHVFPKTVNINESGWHYMKVVGFFEARASQNDYTGNYELQDCVYKMAFKKDPGDILISMYMAPSKKHFSNSKSSQWRVGGYWYICGGYSDPKKDNVKACTFSS